MALEYQMLTERVGDEDAVVHALKLAWEPFAVGLDEEGENCIFFRKLVNVERDEKATDYGVPSEQIEGHRVETEFDGA